MGQGNKLLGGREREKEKDRGGDGDGEIKQVKRQLGIRKRKGNI